MCMPRGTRQSSTQTVHVLLVREWGAIGVGRGSVDLIVDQSMPRRSMMCVPSVTVPERTAVPPELTKVTVAFSHHRWSVASRVGVLQVSAAGAGEAEEAPGRGEFGTAGPEAGDWVPLPWGTEGAEGAADREEAAGSADEYREEDFR